MNKNLIERVTLVLLIFIFAYIFPLYGKTMNDTDVAGRAQKTVIDQNGEVTVTFDWLARPGEFALTIEYFGYLTQEGMVNAYLSVNGIQREFITLKEELPNRHQRIKILSFHPMDTKKGGKGLKKISSNEMIDYMLFRNAPYYPQFGEVQIEIKFFANGRWDGDGNRNDANYVFNFKSPIKAEVQDHF